MKPTFPRFNYAINSTLEFYELDYIVRYLQFYNGDGTMYEKYLQDWIQYALNGHSRLDDEIAQIIHTTNANTQVHFFEDVKDWLRDYRIREVNKELLTERIQKYNQRRLSEFEDDVQKKSDEYFKSPDRQYKHLETYHGRPDFKWFFPYIPNSDKLELKTNYNYYCVEERPGLLNLDHLDRYCRVVELVINSFKGTVNKYIPLYESGKIFGNSQVNVQALQIENRIQPPLELPEAHPQPRKKIKWNGSGKEFVEFFAPLITERKLYLNKKNRGDTDPIAELLYEAFEISKDKGKGEIALTSLKSYFKEFNANPVR